MEFAHWFVTKLGGFLYKTYIVNAPALLTGFAIAVAMALLVLLIELAYRGFDKSGLRRILFDRSKSTITDIVYFLIHTLGVITVFSMLVSAGIPYIVSNAITGVIKLDLGRSMHPVLHLAVFLLLADFLAYWQHRIMHEVPFLWKIHEFHHAAEEFNTLTVFREHPLDKAINTVVMIIPAVLLGSPLPEFTLFIMIYGIVGYLKHSEIPWHGWVGKWLIQSPRDHHIHHSKVREHHDLNYANNFAIWDHLFGTYYNGTNFDSVLGIEQDYLNKDGVLKDTIATQWRFFVGFVDFVRRKKQTDRNPSTQDT